MRLLNLVYSIQFQDGMISFFDVFNYIVTAIVQIIYKP